jgi:ATP-binding cassette subfamily B protein
VNRRYLIPEVFQTATADGACACLQAILGGFGVSVAPATWQPAVAGSAGAAPIDVIAAAAPRLGIEVLQHTEPLELLAQSLTNRLPAIATVNVAADEPRVMVLWRTLGPWVQVMDPVAGRSWVSGRSLIRSLQIREQSVPVQRWRDCLDAPTFTAELEQQMLALDLPVVLWPDRAHQAAALRLLRTLRETGLASGADSHRLWALCAVNPQEIPQSFWPAWQDSADADRMIVRAPTLLSITGIALPMRAADRAEHPAPPIGADSFTSIWKPVWEALVAGGWRFPGTLIAALSAAAVGTVIEALLFRGLFDLGRHLQSAAERLGAIAALVLFLVILLALDWPAARGMYGLGRRLELMLRIRFLLKVPRAGTGGSQPRRLADLAFRAHWLFLPRQLIETVGFSFYLFANILLTGVAIVWVYPGSLLLVILAVIGAGCLPAIFFPAMARRDMAYREHSATLGSMYWDSLQGARVIQAHGAQLGIRNEYSHQLRRWAAAGLRLQWTYARAETLQLAIACLCTIGLVYRQAAVQQSPAGLLLLIYWATSIPVLGREFAAQVRSIPAMRSTLLRFAELVQLQPEEQPDSAASADLGAAREAAAVSIDFSEVSVSIGDRIVLDRINLYAEPGEHIGIVGVSGAGKSTLLGCLLGWHRPSCGSLRVDHAPLDAGRLARLRSETAWIDSQVHLFPATLYDNLRYGNERSAAATIGVAVEAADLGPVLECLPQGLQTPIGESGARLSGGEGQRLRIGRAVARSNVRLAILDEPARGLGREQRRRLIAAVRRRFSNATLLCATHDIADTLEFDRVLVIDQGRIVEQGCPQKLSAAADSRYRALLDDERAVLRGVWSNPRWRRLQLHAGALREGVAHNDIRIIGEGRARQL